MAPELATPLTVDEIRDSLTPDEQIELDKPDFMEPLKLFLEGLEKMPDLKKTFKATMLDKIRQHVNQRTEIRNAISKNPDILKTQINPVVIIGMARTGTTMLQRLLASSPDFMSPMGWEIMHPCPPGRPENWRECERYQRAKASLEKLIPGGFDELLHMHEIKLEAPDECMLLLQAYFLDIGYTMSPTMEKWKNFSFYPPQENLKSAYEYYKKALQCIFYKSLKDGQLPLLKAPIHTLYLDTYRNTFPNAKFIFPYRNAREMVGSGCSIFRMGAAVLGVDVDKADVKKYVLEYYRLGSSRVVQTLKTTPQDSVFTISYTEMVKDPAAAVRNIYSHFGWKMTPEVEQNLQLHMQENRQHKFGEHKYSLEEYGITEDEVRENLPEFLDYFGKNEKLL